MTKNSSPTRKKVANEELKASRREISVSRYQHSGPIPDPVTLEQYEQILPGSAHRILTMAEEQAAHRKKMEYIVIKSRVRDSLLGIIAGFLIALTTILAGAYVVLHGHVLSGTFLGTAGLAGLVYVFIYGTRSARQEREGKQI